ncbi:SGNH hydrolase [Auriculariales sp. MPI-PUGE-AT-0066]|nr:SGNH hydrolase [Auriculariales sp. MPI-PUGE-AT-0066]
MLPNLGVALQTVTTYLSLLQPRTISPPTIHNLVIFGDSYIDVDVVFNGGQAWPVYAGLYGNMSMHSFARAGGSCSKALTPRPNIPAPYLMEDMIPQFAASNLTTTLDMSKTLFTLWFGTNDVGIGNILTGDATPGVTVVDTTKCTVNAVKTLYDLGARNFLFMNMIPLHRTIFYGPNGKPWMYWTAAHDPKSWVIFMEQATNSWNTIGELLLKDMAKELSEAHIGILDSYALFEDIYNNPASYLNGTDPISVDTAPAQCEYEVDGGPVGGECPPIITDGARRDSYMWWDELHPGEQTGRVVAKEVVQSVSAGGSKWARWLS